MEPMYKVILNYKYFDWYAIKESDRKWKRKEITEIVGAERLLDFIAFHKFRSGGAEFKATIEKVDFIEEA